MTTITIQSHSSIMFQIRPFSPFRLDLAQAVRDKQHSETLTNAVAIRILKEIRIKSQIMSFLTKPVVLIPVGILLVAGALTASFLIPPSTSLVLNIASIIFCALLSGVAGGFLGFSIENTFTGFLPQLSEAYNDQARHASHYIAQLQQRPEARVELARPAPTPALGLFGHAFG